MTADVASILRNMLLMRRLWAADSRSEDSGIEDIPPVAQAMDADLDKKDLLSTRSCNYHHWCRWYRVEYDTPRPCRVCRDLATVSSSRKERISLRCTGCEIDVCSVCLKGCYAERWLYLPQNRFRVGQGAKGPGGGGAEVMFEARRC